MVVISQEGFRQVSVIKWCMCKGVECTMSTKNIIK